MLQTYFTGNAWVAYHAIPHTSDPDRWLVVKTVGPVPSTTFDSAPVVAVCSSEAAATDLAVEYATDGWSRYAGHDAVHVDHPQAALAVALDQMIDADDAVVRLSPPEQRAPTEGELSVHTPDFATPRTFMVPDPK